MNLEMIGIFMDAHRVWKIQNIQARVSSLVTIPPATAKKSVSKERNSRRGLLRSVESGSNFLCKVLLIDCEQW